MSAPAFLEARDLLLGARGDYRSGAPGRSAGPQLETFNWALDFLDVVPPARPPRAGHRERGRRAPTTRTFGELHGALEPRRELAARRSASGAATAC